MNFIVCLLRDLTKQELIDIYFIQLYILIYIVAVCYFFTFPYRKGVRLKFLYSVILKMLNVYTVIVIKI